VKEVASFKSPRFGS